MDNSYTKNTHKFSTLLKDTSAYRLQDGGIQLSYLCLFLEAIAAVLDMSFPPLMVFYFPLVLHLRLSQKINEVWSQQSLTKNTSL